MSVHSLQEKRLDAAKEKVHFEMVNYFLGLDAQRQLWYFMLAIRLEAQGNRFTPAQAEELLEHLISQYGIRRANIEAAVAFDPFVNHVEKHSLLVARLRPIRISGERFQEQITVLYALLKEKILEYRQVLELAVIVIRHYPASRRVFP